MRYLLNCSGKKFNPKEKNLGQLGELSFNNELYTYRREIINSSKIQLDWTKTLPAWKLYSEGIVYKQVSEQNWLNENTDIIILSALFGWIKHTDKIPYYDISMNKHKINGKLVYRLWLEYDVLGGFINKNKDIDLLTQPYRKAIHNKKDPVALTPYSKFKDNYGNHKGKWLDKELIKL